LCRSVKSWNSFGFGMVYRLIRVYLGLFITFHLYPGQEYSGVESVRNQVGFSFSDYFG